MTEPWTLFGEQSRPPTTIQIARVGFGLMGTTSLEVALARLGYTPLQDDVIWQVADAFREYFKTRDEDVDAAKECIMDTLGQRGFDVVFLYDKEFLRWAARPDVDVKVILGVRDSATVWAQSGAVADFGRVFFEAPFKYLPSVQEMMPTLRATEQFHINHAAPELYKDIPTLEAAYNNHVERVNRMVPHEKLLVLNVKDGWQPLCVFLDKLVPPDDVSFPHVNNRVVMATLVATLWAAVYLWPIMVASSILLVSVGTSSMGSSTKLNAQDGVDNIRKLFFNMRSMLCNILAMK